MADLRKLVPQRKFQALLGLDADPFGRAITAGRIPKPDVQLSRKRRYWRQETVERFIGGTPALKESREAV